MSGKYTETYTPQYKPTDFSHYTPADYELTKKVGDAFVQAKHDKRKADIFAMCTDDYEYVGPVRRLEPGIENYRAYYENFYKGFPDELWTNLDSRVDNGRYIMEWVEEMTLCGDWDFFGIKVKGSEEPRRVAYCGITYFDVNSEGKVYRQVEHFDVMNLLKELGVLKAIVEKMK